MAILADGKVQVQGKPKALIANIDGQVWSKILSRDEFESTKQEFQVISSRLATGRRLIHVKSEFQPALGFEPVSPSLEDVYFDALYNASNIGGAQ